jgi:hypothetical protein
MRSLLLAAFLLLVLAACADRKPASGDADAVGHYVGGQLGQHF